MSVKLTYFGFELTPVKHSDVRVVATHGYQLGLGGVDRNTPIEQKHIE